MNTTIRETYAQRKHREQSAITADEYRAKIRAEHEAREESFDRSDTDGFLSQWAASEMARRYSVLATLADNGFRAEFAVPFDLDGNRLDAQRVESQYGGTRWGVRNADGSRWYFNESEAENPKVARRNNAKKGIYMGIVAGDAYYEPGTGFVLVDPANAEIVDNGQ